MELDAMDRKLLNRLQIELPLVKHPWNTIAEELGLQQGDVLQRLERLKKEGFIRRIGGVFNPAGLGYRGCLYAMTVREDLFYQTAAVINSFKGVTHNYRRRSRLNMWFTLSFRTEEERGAILETISEAAGGPRLYEFPSEQIFKLKVFLNMEEKATASAITPNPNLNGGTTFKQELCKIENTDMQLIRELQGDLPLLPEPYTEIAYKTGCSLEEVFRRLQTLQAGGALKRIGAVLKHREAGFSANGLFVSVLPKKHISEAGKRLAGYSEVSHCYKRRAHPDWPYNLYAMIHGPDEASVRKVAEHFVKQEGIKEYDILFSTEELKKTSFSI
ncbi:DNA-binding transcriptional regulator, Lrp family [Paenibacillus sophorae]|uniref:siroheme decarboxylase n=1 Tax=Paenibacillus sophorae TaxID=1333845 RepID=A0A1H8FIN4_9BACL|nr:AsnC family transcriptional regulator [Paenibacillus sophorae]QWU13868.1 AsnC family transcriptional regulator [Paenibacillus sophorae]SEN30928.1 DNA-binding transcriptional regulator, Lrp family [Paenibacillus sophorae]